MSKSIDIDFTPLHPPETSQINQMDSDFDQHLADMKKYILELREKKTKQLCALWIKKLCEISDSGDLNSKNIRNMYSARLLSILENCDALQYPFNERPPNEALRPLDELEMKSARSHIETSRSVHHNLNSVHTDTATLKNLSIFKPDMDLYSLKHDYSHEIDQYASTFNQNSFISRIQEERSQKSSFDYQLRLLEAKFKEEKCNLQQMHSNEIQKILDRKNNELESLKSSFSKKKKDYEESIHSLEKKIQSLQKELGSQREENETKLCELRNRTESSYEKRLFDTEKKFNEMINKYEKDKFEMQVQHAKAFQDLVDETNIRLRKVEQEYNDQQSMNDKIIMELENRTNLLKTEMEKNIMLARTLESDNKEKQSVIESLERRLKEENKKNIELEHTMHKARDSHKKEMGSLNSKLESNLAEKTKEADNLKKRVQNLREEISNCKSEMDKKCENFSQMLKEKENQLVSAMNTIKQQKIQAETALNELKKDIEANSNRLYEEMREQINKCESDLVKSKSSKEKQSKEFNKQIEELKNEHRKEIENLLGQFEDQKTKLKNDHEYEMQKIIKNQENFYNQIQQSFQHQVLENNQDYNQKVDELNKTINELENKIINLEQELVDANNLRKHQIAELGLLREDEKNKINRNYETEIENLKIKIDQDELVHKKKLKEIEQRYEADLERLQKQSDERVKKLNNSISELEDDLEKSRLEIRKLKDTLDREKNDSFVRIEEEKSSVKKYCQNQISNLEKELHQEVIRYKNAEKKLKQLSIEQDHYVTKLKMQYEEKLKGLMPIEAKNDYEETISALKNQIESLQQRSIVLQSELDERNHLVNSSDTGSI